MKTKFDELIARKKDQYQNGILWNGFDYQNQAWVSDGRYVRCGHPETLDCKCYGKEHEGQEVQS